jgi:hypothetical protein
VGEVHVVLEAHEALHRHERVLVVQAQPDVVDDREEDETAQEQQGRRQQQPADERMAVHGAVPAALTTTSA